MRHRAEIERIRLIVLAVRCAAILIAGLGLSASVSAEDASLEDNNCVLCHGTEEIWEADTKHLFITAEHLAGDIHWQKGIRCQDCHGGNAAATELREAHAIEDGFRKIESPTDVPKFCGHCHSDADYMRKHQPGASATLVDEFWESAHGQYFKKSPTDGRATSCLTCHPRHATRKADDPASSTFVSNQIHLCGNCHQKPLEEYMVSVHGHGLQNSGLVSTAACADCHGAHGVFAAKDPRSTLHKSRVAMTCAACHRFIEQRLEASVHGRGAGPGRASEKPAPGGTVERTPSCTDCHQGHDLPHPKSDAFRLAEADRCGTCHVELTSQFRQSMHGALTDLGYGPGAKCADCHGAHDILPVADPNSRLSPAHRQATCAQCHPGISQRLLSFDPHADHRNRARSPLLFWVHAGLWVFIASVFGVFGVHSILWFVRGLFEVARHGRPAQLTPGGTAYVRFRPYHRTAHTIMVISFLGLALTGLPLKYSQYAWGQRLAFFLGGFESTGLWHRIFSVTTFACFLFYMSHLLRRYFTGRRQNRSPLGVVFGPDSPLPNFRDLKDFAGMVRWFFGLGPKPTFERWAYWEKFDFFGACSDIILIGTSGLILWFPSFFTLFLPGETVNVAKVIHSTLALLATGFVFAIHFFGTHFRPDKFPMDMSILTGLVSEEELQHERPEYYERLRREGRLDEFRAVTPPRARLWAVGLAGFVALFIGLALLAGIFWGAFT